MPSYMSAQKRSDIRDAIEAGMTGADIMQLLTVSAGTVVRVKREMGLPIRPMRQTRTRGPVKAAAQVAPPQEPTVMPHSYLERVQELKKRGFTPSPEDITSEDEQPAPAQGYTPQEYFQAISDGLRSRDIENDTLRAMVSRLETDNRRLISDLSQCKLQMANWHGPAALPNKSLGNGG